MKVFIAALLLALTVGEPAEYVVRIDGAEVGTARLTERALPDGGKSNQMRMVLKAGGEAAEVVSEAEYAPDGTPRRKYARRTGAGGAEMRVATFAKRTASLTIEVGGERETKSVEAPEGADIRASSEMWNAKGYPAVGTTCKYHRFDLNKGVWEPFEITYKGKQGDVHYMESTAGKAWIASDGLPTKLVSGRLTMVRAKK